MKTKIILSLITLSFFVGILSYSNRTEACGNEVERRRTALTEHLTNIGNDLNRGAPSKAYRRLYKHLRFNLDPKILPKTKNIPIFGFPHRSRTNGEQLRTEMLKIAKVYFAISLVRLKFRRTKTKFYSYPDSDKSKTHRLKPKEIKNWVETVLRENAKSGSPTAIVALAEFELAIDPNSTTALTSLKSLKENDLVPSFHGWVALAKAEKRSGDKEAALASIAICKKRVKKWRRKKCRF